MKPKDYEQKVEIDKTYTFHHIHNFCSDILKDIYTPIHCIQVVEINETYTLHYIHNIL